MKKAFAILVLSFGLAACGGQVDASLAGGCCSGCADEPSAGESPAAAAALAPALAAPAADEHGACCAGEATPAVAADGACCAEKATDTCGTGGGCCAADAPAAPKKTDHKN